MAFKARDDRHKLHAHVQSHLLPVISCDFCFTSRTDEGGADVQKLVCLVICDRDTRLIQAVPVPKKGGESVEMLVSAIVRFIAYLGYENCILRSDGEPTQVAIKSRVQKVRLKMGLRTQLEDSPKGDHQANGLIEQALQSIRHQACILLSQLERGANISVETKHCLHAWAFVHASFFAQPLSRECEWYHGL